MENSLTTLAERLKAKTESERQEAEALIRQNFTALSQSLSASSKDALRTTEIAIRDNLSNMEKNLSSQCRIMGQLFSRQYRLALAWSMGILLLTIVTAWGLITLARYRITELESEITALNERKLTLEEGYAEVWRTFKGLEAYHAEGQDYLLTARGWSIVHAGTVDKRDAWQVVRK